jgi:hypothetical protein
MEEGQADHSNGCEESNFRWPPAKTQGGQAFILDIIKNSQPCPPNPSKSSDLCSYGTQQARIAYGKKQSEAFE